MIVSACSHPPTDSSDAGKIVIVGTIFPFSDWASHVGGDRVAVHTLLPPGSSPHTFAPSPGDMRRLAHARLFIRCGLHLDDWGTRLARASDTSAPIILALGDRLAQSGQLPRLDSLLSGTINIGHPPSDDHDHEGINPHFWLDPRLAIDAVRLIRDSLVRIDPAGKTEYDRNTEAYVRQLRQLDDSLSQTLSVLPRRDIFTFHNAFPYFAARYHLHIAGVIEEYPGKVPSEQYIRDVTDRLKALHIHTVFYEPQFNPQIAHVVADEIGGTVDVLDPNGDPGRPDRDSYIKTMRFNAARLQSALSGNSDK